MARHVMTPARRAALRKAQLASARKRRKGGGARKSISRRVGQARSNSKARRTLTKAKAQRTRSKVKNIKGRGSYAKRHQTIMKHGTRSQKAAAVYSFSPVAYGISKRRGKKKKKR